MCAGAPQLRGSHFQIDKYPETFSLCAMRSCLNCGAAPGATSVGKSFGLFALTRTVVILSMVALNRAAAGTDLQPHKMANATVGVVSHIKVVSDKVPDVSSLASWKKSFIQDGMSEAEQAIAVWKSNVSFVY